MHVSHCLPQIAPGMRDFLDPTVANALDTLSRLPCEAEQPAIAVNLGPQQRINGAA
jgi:hypothetical protein